MAEFRLTQISDTHLSHKFPKLTDNFHRVADHIDAYRPDLVVNTGDVSWDGPTSRADMEFARELHAALPADCRYLPGNHDIGDNPTAVGVAPSCPATEELRDAFVSVFEEDRWQFEAANWRFIGLNSLIMNTGIPSELEQEEWLNSQLAGANGKPIALFLHKPLFLNTPEDPEEASDCDPLRSAAGARATGCTDPHARCPACRERSCASTPRLHLRAYPAHLGAICRIYRARPDTGCDWREGDRTGGIPVSAREFRGPACPRARSGRHQPG